MQGKRNEAFRYWQKKYLQDTILVLQIFSSLHVKTQELMFKFTPDEIAEGPLQQSY